MGDHNLLSEGWKLPVLTLNALKLLSSGRLFTQKSSTVLPRFPALPDCKSAAPSERGACQLQLPPHTAHPSTALPPRHDHWWSACCWKVLYLRQFTAAISMVTRTFLATRYFRALPCPGWILTLSIWAPTWTSVLPFRTPYWPLRQNLCHFSQDSIRQMHSDSL